MYEGGNKGLGWGMYGWGMYRWDKLDRDKAHFKWVSHIGSKMG